MPCPFCDPDPARLFLERTLVLGLHDGYPVSPGHALLIPRRHVATWFDATREEQLALLEAIDEAKAIIDAKHSPAGYNIGVNIGREAGQTVFHLHVHLIPRYEGDVPDPRGGVRYVIPEKANYLRKTAERAPALSKGAPDDPFAAQIQPLIAHANAITIVAAFVQSSGLELLQNQLRSAQHRGAQIRLLHRRLAHQGPSAWRTVVPAPIAHRTEQPTGPQNQRQSPKVITN